MPRNALAILLALAACAPAPVPNAPAPPGPVLELTPLPSYRGLGDCTGRDTAPCRITTAPSPRLIERRLGTRGAVAWGGRDSWSLAYRADDDSVSAVEAAGGIQLPMSRLAGTRLWLLSLRMPGADSGVVSLDLKIGRGGAVRRDTTSIREWRGPRAPAEPRGAQRLAGTVRTDSVWSEALRVRRGVTVYLPPRRGPERTPVVYLADGQNVRDYAQIVDPLVASGALPPVVLVGVWVSSGSPRGGRATGPADDLRTIEYHPGVESIPGADSAFVVARYRGHRRLFTQEVRRWAEDSLHVSTERRWRAVQGNSSGAHFALTLGREEPELYGMVIANSNGSREALSPPAGGWAAAPRHFLAAGVLEPKLARTLRAMGDSLARHGVPRVVYIYPSGHDYQVWRESLPRALAWWLRPAGTR